jgi:hypothetical protein
MLKKTGNVFIGNLPNNTLNTTIPSFLGNVTIANYTRYERNANIFRTFIKIDVLKAKELGLSYFKTVTINKFENSKYASLKKGYTGLLEENQRIDLKKFISADQLDVNYDLIKEDVLGRDLNLSDFHNKFSIENFSSRKSYNYNVGLSLNAELDIKEYQDLFFECAFSSNLTPSTLFPGSTQYDLIIYAMDNNDQIIDVKKITNFNTATTNWNIDKITFLYDIDDVDFNKIFNVTFDNVILNNLKRRLYINLTDNCKALRDELGFYPIETISIQENSNPIEVQLDRIRIENAFKETDKITLDCETDLMISAVPFELNYKIFMKIYGRNDYIIKNYVNAITNPQAILGISQQENLNRYLRNSNVSYLASLNTIKIELSLLKIANNDNSFNPFISSIFINNNKDKNFANACFNFIPNSSSLENLNLTGTLLKNIITTTKNEEENSFIFYLRNYSDNPFTLKFVFEQDFETYELNFDIKSIYGLVDYEQSLTITNKNNFITSKFSNLDIQYKIKIKNFKNSNINLNRFLSLNYENIFLQELQNGTTQLSRDFENNIFVIVKKSILQDNIHIKDKFYIFNKDVFENLKLQIQTENDLTLDLNFNDNETVNALFFKTFQYDNVDLTKNVNYRFEARIMIIPIGFFITQNDYVTKLRIKELLCLNNINQPIPSAAQINEIFYILKTINDNKFADLNQVYLYKLYQNYCLKNTQANNEILIATANQTNVNDNQITFRSVNYNLNTLKTQTKKLEFILTFDIISKTSNNLTLTSIINNMKNLFTQFYFKDNNILTPTTQIIPEFTNLEIKNELNNTSFKCNITANTLTVIITLNISAEFLRFLSLAYNRSNKNFAPYTFDFLNQNLYLKLNLPDSLSINIGNQSEKISFRNIENQYILLDFYPILN